MKKIIKRAILLIWCIFPLCIYAQNNTSSKYTPKLQPINYNWISYQMKIDLEMPDKQETLSAFLVNRKDSIIYLNIYKSGYELVRIVMTPKEVIYVNRPNTEYYKGNFDFLAKRLGFPLKFNMIQALMTAQLSLNYDTFAEYEKKENIEYYTDNYRIFPPQKNYYSEDIEFNPNTRHLISHSIADLTLMRSIDIEYKNYTKGDMNPFFSNMEIELEEDIKLDIEVKNLKWNIPGPTSVKIPNKYQPIK